MIRSRGGPGISRPSADPGQGPLVVVVAGEASADLHGSKLVRALREIREDLRFLGIGGPLMSAEGVELLAECSELSVVGLTEVVSRFPAISTAYFRLKHLLATQKVSLFILIDYPGFNLRIAKVAKKTGVPVLYYIAPQVWAWRQGRVRKIKQRVDRIAVILPFEEKFFRERGIKADYVGHPLLDNTPAIGCSEALETQAGLRGASPIICLAPGSRVQEVKAILPSMVEALKGLIPKYPNLGCIIPLAPGIKEDLVRSLVIHSNLRVSIWKEGIYSALSLSNAALVTSGTATLETAIMEVPMVVLYKLSPITFWLGKRVVKVNHISLVNLVAGREIVPELIQDAVKPSNIINELLPLLEGGQKRREMLEGIREVKVKLGGGGASKRVAQMAIEMIREEGS